MPSDPFSLLAVCAFGLESVLADELRALGYTDAKPAGVGRVRFSGGPDALARANLFLRTADRVLVQLAEFEAKDFGALFDGVHALPWHEWIPPDARFPVSGRSVRSLLSSVPACQKIVKKAIVDKLLASHGVSELPETGPDFAVEVALLHDRATLTLDSSGVGLHKRGYRPLVGEASLRETLAAALVMLSAWEPGRPLVDPFCGTGTIAIEAALLALDIAPGMHRGFDAERWPAVPVSVWEQARAEARDRAADAPARRPLRHAIHAGDIDENALALSRRHANAAGVDRFIHFKHQPFADLSTKVDHGCIITNPPYGLRLGEERQVEALYASFPGVLKRLPTWSFFILSGRLDLERLVGREATRRRKLYNARIECTYYQFLGPKPPWMVRERAEPPAVETKSPEPVDPEGDRTAPAAPTPTTSPRATGSPASARPAAGPVFVGGLRERDVKELAEFEARLAKNARHLRRWPDRGITCYRLYEKDCPDVPLVVDRYADAAHAVELEREHSRAPGQHADWLEECRRIIARVLEIPLDRVFLKDKPRQRGLNQHEKKDHSRRTMTVTEGGLTFEVNLSDYVDTGLFLDHRQTRAMVRDAARGARFLNLFCYTGAFTVYAAAGAAADTTSVDLSNTYLDWTARNLTLNGFKPNTTGHRLVRSDVLGFLAGHEPGPRYDLAVVDPPTFSNSKRTEQDWEVQTGHAPMLAALMPLLAPDAAVFFSTNFRRFKLDAPALLAAASGLGRTLNIREISRRTVPPDFRNQRIHRCWRLRMDAPPDTATPTDRHADALPAPPDADEGDRLPRDGQGDIGWNDTSGRTHA
jgi:23S rRNA (guanine2445-N2)-methyltransferase / 23S rRNA (guanine2069-N7)-methyltransferase